MRKVIDNYFLNLNLCLLFHIPFSLHVMFETRGFGIIQGFSSRHAYLNSESFDIKNWFDLISHCNTMSFLLFECNYYPRNFVGITPAQQQSIRCK